MRFRPSLSICLLSILCLLSACGKPSATGKYLAKFSDGISWLQLVETPDGHLSGQIEMVTLHKDGKIEHTSLTISGAADHENISISVKPIPFISYEITSSGTLDGNKLKLLMNGTLVEFQRVKFDDYQDQLDILNKESNVILTINLENKFIKNLHNTIEQIVNFNNYVDTHINHGPLIETQYRSITAKMETYLTHERSLTSNPRASNARNQITIAINQGSYATENIHHSVQALQLYFQNNAVPLMKYLDEYEHICQSRQIPGSATNTIPNTTAWAEHCDTLTKLDPIFRQKFKALASSFNHLEDIYQQETKKQANLIQESERIDHD